MSVHDVFPLPLIVKFITSLSGAFSPHICNLAGISVSRSLIAWWFSVSMTILGIPAYGYSESSRGRSSLTESQTISRVHIESLFVGSVMEESALKESFGGVISATSCGYVESLCAGTVIVVSAFKDSSFSVVFSCEGEIFVSASLQWTTADSSTSAPIVSLLLQAVKAHPMSVIKMLASICKAKRNVLV